MVVFVNSQDRLGWTPLLFAIFYGEYECIEFLLNFGANVNLADKSNWSPIIKAGQKGDIRIVRLLCENGANIHDRNCRSSTALIEAVEECHNDVVEYLCLQGSDVNARGSTFSFSPEHHKKTPLLIACNEGFVDIIKILLTFGANHFDRAIVSQLVQWEGRIDFEKTCVAIADYEYRPYIKQIINRWSTTMFILVLQELLVYHQLDAKDIIYFFLFIGDDY